MTHKITTSNYKFYNEKLLSNSGFLRHLTLAKLLSGGDFLVLPKLVQLMTNLIGHILSVIIFRWFVLGQTHSVWPIY